jgi:hypothetical protein
MYIARTAEVSGLDARVIEAEAGAGAPRRIESRPAPPAPRPTMDAPPARPRPTRAPTRVRGPGFSAERELVRAMLRQRSLVERLTERVGPDTFQEPRYREIFATLLAPGPERSVPELAEAMSAPAVEMMQSLLGEPDAIQDLDLTVEHSLARLDERRLTRRNAEIDRLVAMASAEEKNQLMQEKAANMREIARLRDAFEHQ